MPTSSRVRPAWASPEAALDLAAGLVCPEDGCGECPDCRRVREGLHPDVEIAGAGGHLPHRRSDPGDQPGGRPAPVRGARQGHHPPGGGGDEQGGGQRLPEDARGAAPSRALHPGDRLRPRSCSRPSSPAASASPSRRTPAAGHGRRTCGSDFGLLRAGRHGPGPGGPGQPGPGPRAGLRPRRQERRGRLLGWARELPAGRPHGRRGRCWTRCWWRWSRWGEARVAGARSPAGAGPGVGRRRAHAQPAGEGTRAAAQAREAPAATDGLHEITRRRSPCWYRDLALRRPGGRGGRAQPRLPVRAAASRPIPGSVPAYLPGRWPCCRRAEERFRYNVDARLRARLTWCSPSRRPSPSARCRGRRLPQWRQGLLIRSRWSLELERGRPGGGPDQRGPEIGEVVEPPHEIRTEELPAPLQGGRPRVADGQGPGATVAANEELRREALATCRELVAQHGLDMKLVDAEIALRRREDHLQLLRRGAGGLPGSGGRPGQGPQDAHRAAPDRRARGGPHGRRAGSVRAGASAAPCSRATRSRSPSAWPRSRTCRSTP